MQSLNPISSENYKSIYGECLNDFILCRYTKPLVASASNSDQKYNPEITSGVKQDSRVAALGDKLRQARQVCMINIKRFILFDVIIPPL